MSTIWRPAFPVEVKAIRSRADRTPGSTIDAQAETNLCMAYSRNAEEISDSPRTASAALKIPYDLAKIGIRQWLGACRRGRG
jgi:hypothetical protein